MAKKIDLALNPGNLAKIGAIDDFYDLYISIQEIYEENQQVYLRNHPYLLPLDWEKLARKDVRKVCEPLMNEYLVLFTNDYSKIFANAHGFDSFIFLNWKLNDKACEKRYGHVKVWFKSFDSFLIELQYAVTRIIHKWKSNVKPQTLFEDVLDEVNHHIVTYVAENAKVIVRQSKSTSMPSSDVLYIYENLSSTFCYINKHDIVPGSYTANMTTGSGQIQFPVHFCTQCKKFFIGEKTLRAFESQYGKLLIPKKKMSTTEGFYNSLNMESRLHQFGYNVSDGRFDAERQALLKALLDGGYITYFEMVRCIEWNINNLKHNTFALEKWKRDLKYIGQYILDEHS